MDAEVVVEWRVLAAPVAEDVPGDLRRTADEELEAPDVLTVMSRCGREDGAPPLREAPESKNLRARFPVVSPPAAGRANPGDDDPQGLEAVDDRGWGLAGDLFTHVQNPFDAMIRAWICGTGPSTIQRR